MDCLYVEDDVLFLVEFKNVVKINKKIDDIKMKIHDTMSMMNYFYDFNDLDFELIKIVIVNKPSESSPTGMFGKHMNQISKSSCPPRLIFLEKVYRIKISVMDSDEFLEKMCV